MVGLAEVMEVSMNRSVVKTAEKVFEDGEWWYYYPEDGTSIVTSGGRLRERASTLKAKHERARQGRQA